MNSIFDEYYETLIKEAIGLNEMPVSRIASDLTSFKPSKELGSYSITDITGEDEEKIKQVLVKVGEYVIDNLKEPSSASRKEYQDVVAEFIRKAINDVFPDSKKASGGSLLLPEITMLQELLSRLSKTRILLTPMILVVRLKKALLKKMSYLKQ